MRESIREDCSDNDILWFDRKVNVKVIDDVTGFCSFCETSKIFEKIRLISFLRSVDVDDVKLITTNSHHLIQFVIDDSSNNKSRSEIDSDAFSVTLADQLQVIIF